MQEPYRFGFGGSCSGAKVSLKTALCVAAGQALHLGHPHSFNVTQNLTSVLLSASRVSGPLTGLQNQLGFSQRWFCASRKPFIILFTFSALTGNRILDSLLKSVRRPILDMKVEIEESQGKGLKCSGAKGRTGPAAFTAVSDNVSLEVSRSLK